MNSERFFWTSYDLPYDNAEPDAEGTLTATDELYDAEEELLLGGLKAADIPTVRISERTRHPKGDGPPNGQGVPNYGEFVIAIPTTELTNRRLQAVEKLGFAEERELTPA